MDNRNIDQLIHNELMKTSPTAHNTNLENLQGQINYFQKAIKALAESTTSELERTNQTTIVLLKDLLEQVSLLVDEKMAGLYEYNALQNNDTNDLTEVLKSFISLMMVTRDEYNSEIWDSHKNVVLSFLENKQEMN